MASSTWTSSSLRMCASVICVRDATWFWRIGIVRGPYWDGLDE